MSQWWMLLAKSCHRYSEPGSKRGARCASPTSGGGQLHVSLFALHWYNILFRHVWQQLKKWSVFLIPVNRSLYSLYAIASPLRFLQINEFNGAAKKWMGSISIAVWVYEVCSPLPCPRSSRVPAPCVRASLQGSWLSTDSTQVVCISVSLTGNITSPCQFTKVTFIFQTRRLPPFPPQVWPRINSCFRITA